MLSKLEIASTELLRQMRTVQLALADFDSKTSGLVRKSSDDLLNASNAARIEGNKNAIKYGSELVGVVEDTAHAALAPHKVVDQIDTTASSTPTNTR